MGVGAGVLAAIEHEAALAYPLEACGLLLGTADLIVQATVCTNIHPTPLTHFEIDPTSLIAAHKMARGGGPGIAGYWHSHPTGGAAPSATDQASSSGDGRIWAIVAGDAVSFWRDGIGGFEPLSTRVVAG